MREWKRFGVWHENPLVLITPHGDFFIKAAGEGWWDPAVKYSMGVPDVLGIDNALFLIQPSHTLEGPSGIRWLDYLAEYLREEAVSVVVLGCTPKEVELARARGIRSELVNQNCLIDETVFTILAKDVKYDAVYNAQMHSFKRHYLARDIARLALIYFVFDYQEHNSAYYSKVRQWLPHATYCNGPLPDGYELFAPFEVAEICNRATCGLALSEIEGAMWASIEYLLCGLPVVSTRSLGGRDMFFTPETAVLCNDDPGEIAEAVEVLNRDPRSRQRVRDITLDLVMQHRQKLVELISEFVPDFGMGQLLQNIRHSPKGYQFFSFRALKAALQ